MSGRAEHINAAALTTALTLTIAVGVQDRPAAAPINEPWKPDFKLLNNPPFHSGVAAIGSLIFAYGGIPAMFSVIAEMKDPRDFKKSLAFAQTTLTVTYLVSARTLRKDLPDIRSLALSSTATAEATSRIPRWAVLAC